MNEPDFKGKTIMAVGAHPDDIDFMAGATVARAVNEGAKVIYVLATTGQKGGNEKGLTQERLSKIRQEEQSNAAKVLGVSEVNFMEYVDGELFPTLELKSKVVMYIRKYKPDIVISMNPSYFYSVETGYINHSDHRAIGEATLDAVYPLARDILSFPEHASVGLAPYKVKTVLLQTWQQEANCFIDVTSTIEKKIEALTNHKSQIADIGGMEKRIRSWLSQNGKRADYKYAEAFIRLNLPG